MTDPGSSPFKTRDEENHVSQMGRWEPRAVDEFYGPFTMVLDVVELVRVANASYGEMDFAYLLGKKPVQVYAGSDNGERFLRERFPNAKAYRARALSIDEMDRGRTIVGNVEAQAGPLRMLSLVVRARPDAKYAVERYEGHSVWGSDLSCYGIDMRVAAWARGVVQWEGEDAKSVDKEATLFRGSYGRILPNAQDVTSPTRAEPRRKSR